MALRQHSKSQTANHSLPRQVPTSAMRMRRQKLVMQADINDVRSEVIAKTGRHLKAYKPMRFLEHHQSQEPRKGGFQKGFFAKCTPLLALAL